MKTMTFTQFESTATLNDAAAELILQFLTQESTLVLPTGKTPSGVYARVTERIRDEQPDISMAMVAMLDEWLGLPPHHAKSCFAYLKNHVLTPWNVLPERFVEIDIHQEAEKAAAVYAHRLSLTPRPWLVVLGLGVNGHIGMNEPTPAPQSGVHVAELAESTRAVAKNDGFDPVPTHGITLGVADICEADHVLLLVNSVSKREALLKTMEDKVDPLVPASLLRNAKKVDVFHTGVLD